MASTKLWFKLGNLFFLETGNEGCFFTCIKGICLQTKLEFSEEVKDEEKKAPESDVVFIKMEAEEENDKPCSLPKVSEEPDGESCQVFVKEDIEEKNAIEISFDVSCREKDPLSR